MPEYIDRGLLRRAMRGVWADPDCPKDIADYIMHIVDLLPAEKVTKVVRCEDCILWDKRTTNKNGFDICPASSMEIHDRDYCSYGERKGGAENAG